MTNPTSFQRLSLILAPLLIGACQGEASVVPLTSAPPSRGHAFATASCAACHAVERDSGWSPNADAPPFSAIVNKEGLTAKTLSVWLRDAHNYPNEMQFELEPGKIDDLVTYMLTLRDLNYRPPS